MIFVMNNWRELQWTSGLCVVVAWVFTSGLTTCQASDSSQGIPGLYMYRYPKEDLGATYSAQATTVKLWAPTAKTVSVALFDDAAGPSFSSLPMECDSNGIWSATINGNVDGKYYLYAITLPGRRAGQTVTNRVNDPYARGCSANTGRTLIYDPVQTQPEGWARDQFVRLTNNTDAILYEAHIRDFSINTNSGASPLNRGKYMGMVEDGTKTPEGGKSGLNHLEELGINPLSRFGVARVQARALFCQSVETIIGVSISPAN